MNERTVKVGARAREVNMRAEALAVLAGLGLGFAGGGRGALAQVAAPEPVMQRVYAINYNPILENKGGPRLNVWANWGNPSTLNAQYVSDLAQSSGNLLEQRVNFSIDADMYPVKADGYRYTDASYTGNWGVNNWHQPDAVDYGAIARDYDLARRVDLGQVDEVFVHGAPYFGYYESRMMGAGGYWCNSPPLRALASQRMWVMMGFNYERGVAEMLHSNSHRSESIMSKTYLTWNLSNPQTLWDRFTQNYGQTAPRAAVGTCHWPANAAADYDYGNTRVVQSTAVDWELNFPNLTGQTAPVSRDTWGGPDYHRNYMKWWYAHMPKLGGTNSKDEFTRLNNWWQYLKNMNGWQESGGSFVKGSYGIAFNAYWRTPRALTDGARDAWFPQVNDGGRIVWSAFDGTRHHVYSANYNGSGLVQLSPAGGLWTVHEMAKINAQGRVVWQSFNGKNWHVFSANADGTGLVQLSSGNLDSKHPEINNDASAPGGGVVVYQWFDGAVWQIRAVNADGSNNRALTSGTAPDGQIPRDSVWPQINTPSSGTAKVVYMRHTGTDWEIYSIGVDGTGEVNVSNRGDQLDEYPRINDSGRVVWHGWKSDTNADINAANADGTGFRQVTSTTGAVEMWPRINNLGRIVYMARPNTALGWQIFSGLSNTGTPAAITSGYAQNGYPVVDNTSSGGGRITWQSFDGTAYQIYTRVGSVTYKVSTGAQDQRAPAVSPSGEFIVWHGEDGPQAYTRIHALSTRPLCAADLNDDFFVDDQDFVLFAAAYDLFTVPPASAACDLNGDGFVDDSDFVTFAQAYDAFTCP